MNSVTLSNGVKMPILGLGTFQAKGAKVTAAVETAIDIGYRHIDTAAVYENEKLIGVAIKKKISQGILKREDLFITTKLSPFRHSRLGVKQSLETSLRSLDITYVDLFLIHYPCCYGEAIDFLDTWKGLEEVYKLGLAKSIGISNFNLSQIQRLIEHAEVKPHALQIEINANFHQKDLHDFCKRLGISLIAFAPLGCPGSQIVGVGQNEYSASILNDPVVKSIAVTHKGTPAQVALSYLIHRQICVIPKSITTERIKENYQAFELKLSMNEVNQLSSIPERNRLYSLNMMKNRPNYPF